MIIAGIDGSLSSTGFCSMRDGSVIACGQYEDKEQLMMPFRMRRIASVVVGSIIYQVEKGEEVNVFTEEPCGALQGYAANLNALYWFIVEEFYSVQSANQIVVNIYPVAQKSLTKFITGNGNAKHKDKAYSVTQTWMELLPEEFHVTDSTKPKGIMKYADLFDALSLCKLGECFFNSEGFEKYQVEIAGKIGRLNG